MKLFARLIPKKQGAIVILNGAGRSGSNGYLFYKYLRQHHPEVEVNLIEPWPSSHLPLSAWKQIGQAQFIITTHQPFKVKKSQVSLSFWHGIPLKRMGFMAHNTSLKLNLHNLSVWNKNADIVASSSDTYESLLTACIGISANRYRRIGFPRLDFLKATFDKQKLLQDLFKVADKEAKIGIYMPTFRFELEDESVMKQIKNGNFFAFSDFDLTSLNQELQKHHQYLIIKLHPYEMNLVSLKTSQASNIAFLSNDYLFNNGIDLYELLPATDFLITDFSSIYFDYLELNRPIIFVTNFLAQYEKTRGLLLTPYDKVVPGPTVGSQLELLNLLNDFDDTYQEQRQYWKKLVLQTKNSCESTYELIQRMK
ncbi:teichoic acid biosynthesis protein [Lactobacillus psittaci DSM 15354]|uniref:Teichoic acid biosynthesis protein n=2 Tax=Lactobacillus psittaci TaxID=116089 RepID=A0A0R1S768_9LACO|nr:teichoic acid biosynthesis protein [Lactobacillus psittaci DSM 15354]